MKWVSFDDDVEMDRDHLKPGGEICVPTGGAVYIELDDDTCLKISVSEWGTIERLLKSEIP